MADPVDDLHSGLVDAEVYDDADDVQTRVTKTADFLAKAPGLTPERKMVILRNVQNAASRQARPADFGAKNQAAIERESEIAAGNSGLQRLADAPMGIGYPLLAINRGFRATTAGMDRGIAGISDVIGGKDNAFSKFVKGRAEDVMTPDSQLAAPVEKTVDFAANMLPMMTPAGAALVGGGQGAETAIDAGADRGTAALAGGITGALNVFIPGALGPKIQRAAAPVANKIGNAVARNVVEDVIQGAGTGFGLGVGNAAGQVPTAIDIGSMDPVYEQAKAIPEMTVLGAGMHPIIAGGKRAMDAQVVRKQIAAEDQIRATQATFDGQAGRDAQYEQNARSSMHANAIDQSLVKLGESQGVHPDAVLGELSSRTQVYIDRGIPEMPAKVKAAQELAQVIRAGQMSGRDPLGWADGAKAEAGIPPRDPMAWANETAPARDPLSWAKTHEAEVADRAAVGGPRDPLAWAEPSRLGEQSGIQRTAASDADSMAAAGVTPPWKPSENMGAGVPATLEGTKPFEPRGKPRTALKEATKRQQIDEAYARRKAIDDEIKQKQIELAHEQQRLRGVVGTGDDLGVPTEVVPRDPTATRPPVSKPAPPVVREAPPTEAPVAPREVAPEAGIAKPAPATDNPVVQSLIQQTVSARAKIKAAQESGDDAAWDAAGKELDAALSEMRRLGLDAFKLDPHLAAFKPLTPEQRATGMAELEKTLSPAMSKFNDDVRTAAVARSNANSAEEAAVTNAKSKAATVIAKGPKGSLVTNGKDLFVSGNKIGPDTPALRDSLMKAIGATPSPKAEARPETAPAPEPVAPETKSAERLAWEAEKSKLGDKPAEIPADTDTQPRSKDRYRAGIRQRGSFDPTDVLIKAYDKGANTLGEVVESIRKLGDGYVTEGELTALKQKYYQMKAENEAITKSGFWNKADDRVRNTLSMESVAARNPDVRRVVGTVQRIRDKENEIVGQHMRAVDPFISAPPEMRAKLHAAAFHFMYEAPRAPLDSVMPNGQRLSPSEQAAVKAAFDTSRKATADFIADIDRAQGGIPEELAKFRDIMVKLLKDPDSRYIPMRRFGDIRIMGRASTVDQIARLGNKAKLTPEESTVLRLARIAEGQGEKDFTYYYGAADSDAAMATQYAKDASKYEAATGGKIERTTYDPAFDRAKSLGISAEQVQRLAVQAGLKPDAILDMLAALPMRGQRSSAIEARGVPGASTDNARSMGQWFSHMASMRANAGEAANLARALARVKDPAMRKRMSDYIDLQKQPVNAKATTGKAFLNLFAMGFRPASAMAEGVGGLVMAPAKLMAIGMPRASAESFGEMVKSNALNMWRLAHLGKESMLDVAKAKLPAQMAADMQASADTGRFGNQAFRDEMRQQSKSVIQNLTEKAMILHRNVREANALGVWSATYKLAAEGKMPSHVIKALEMQGIDLKERTPRAIADAVVDFTLNRVDKTTMPMWQSQSTAGQMIGTLTSYQTRSLAQMIDIARVWHNIPETRAYGAGAAAALVAMFGAGAIPFGNWLMSASQMLDSDPRTVDTKALSNKGVQFAAYGGTGLAAEAIAKSMGADEKVAKKVGHRFDAFARRTAWGNFLNTSGTSILDQIPAVSLMASMGRSASQGWEGVERGDWWTAAEGAAGTMSLAGKDVVKGARAALTGKVVNSAADTVSTDSSVASGLGQMAGFGMSDTQISGADSATRMAINNARKKEIKRLAYRFANTTDTQSVIEDLNAWNAKYLARRDMVGYSMVIKGSAISNAIKRAMVREEMGAHESAVMDAKGSDAMVLAENE